MKALLAVALAATATVTVASSAYAADGCGRGYHRGPYGHCRPNWRHGPRVVAEPLVVDRFYAGRGYWDGNRYWWHRDRWHDHWRYR
jgi:hypothetical protein